VEATEQKAAHNDRMGVFLCALRFDLYGLCVKSVAFVCGCATPRQKSGAELGLRIEAGSVFSVSSCKILFERSKDPSPSAMPGNRRNPERLQA
jgi:hypothetical protein